MNKNRLIFYSFLLTTLLISTLFTSCSSTKSSTSKIQSAEQLFAQKKYNEALNAFEAIIHSYEAKGQENECPVYTKAAIAAKQLGQKEKALEYLKKAEYSKAANEDTFVTLADCYKDQNNLSKELMALEDYLKKYPQGEKSQEVKKRLFNLYVLSENYDKALALWKELNEPLRKEPELIENYFKVNRALNNKKACDSLAPIILDFHPDNREVLEWEGEKYYNRAEERYQKEMKAYQHNRTNKQYNQLLKALNAVSKDYNKALSYFQRLYKMDPKPKYAKYLANIYNRLDNKSKADYYKNKAGL